MNYAEAKLEAQTKADETGYDYGVMKNAFGGYSCFMLPQKRNRGGSELRCEVVSCSNLSRCQIGHGPV